MRRSIAGGVVIAAIGVAALVAVGSASANGDAASVTTLGDTIGNVQDQIDQLRAVQNVSQSMLWAVGGLAGIGVGVAVGSVVSYIGWRR